MKTAEELHDYIQAIVRPEDAIARLVFVVEKLNDRCRVLESRLAVAEAKLNARAANHKGGV